MICQFLSDIPNLGVHAYFTSLTFSATLLVILANLTPGIYYAWSHYALRANEARLEGMSTLKMVKLGAAVLLWLTSGLMRRGPLLRYNEVKLGTGFGVSSTKDAEADPEGPNVIDWEGCPLLKLVTLSQVSQNKSVLIRTTA
jgi:hypothetical protein